MIRMSVVDSQSIFEFCNFPDFRVSLAITPELPATILKMLRRVDFAFRIDSRTGMGFASFLLDFVDIRSIFRARGRRSPGYSII